ncbi:hypothetical protein SESBI_22124 [Sesbania bispinosa]|nr:hypothetical protein SESBI_22124 [Sesbania bispinosa]
MSVAALDTPITWEAFRTPFLGRYFPTLIKRKRDEFPLEESSGGSVMNGKVSQPSERRSSTFVECGKGHKGRCLQGQGRYFYCYHPGHMKKDCPKKKTETLTSSSQGDPYP